MTSGEGILTSLTTLHRCAMVALALTVALAGSLLATDARAAGAFAIGKCGAYGEAYDYAGEAAALAAARKQCKGECTTVTMRRGCAALSIDLTNPCGAHGYAVTPRISSTLNTATRKCYEFGGKECVIRAWACDAKG
jgi:Domain of unknown function (DUF4189)